MPPLQIFITQWLSVIQFVSHTVAVMGLHLSKKNSPFLNCTTNWESNIWEITVGKNPSACKFVRHLSIQNYTELRHVGKILLKWIVNKPFYFILRVSYLLPAARRRSVIWYKSCTKLVCVSANLLCLEKKVKVNC